MPSYSTVKKFAIGQFTATPSKQIDDIYLKTKHSILSNTTDAIKLRAIFLFSFVPRMFIDLIFITLVYSGLTLAKLLPQNKSEISWYDRKANKFRDLLFKHLFGLLAFPVGLFISPKLVVLYFIPKRENHGHILSGNHLDSAHPEIRHPKSIEELKSIVAKANQSGKKITIIGAGRSQGKQFLPTSNTGIVISMQHFKEINIHPDKKTVVVGAGAVWGEIQAEANKHALALKVMQASNVFSVGGSISTNIHGWNKSGTLAETIKSLTIMNATGKIQKLTPKDELFQYVVGGYNQFGIILNAEIELTNNEKLVQKSHHVKPADYVNYFKENVLHNDNKRMHLYRLSLDPNNMLGEGVAVNYMETDKTYVKSSPQFQLEPTTGTRFQRTLINLARHFSWVRALYWKLTKIELVENEPTLTTNEIMQPPINAMFNNALSEAEWLQEFFVPEENLAKFLNELGSLLQKNNVTLLNATVRYVKQDTISKMGYANQGDRFAVVLCFNQKLNENDVLNAKKWIRQATDLVLKNRGTYYLPYQPFASREQFLKAYPTAEAVYQKKLEVDPKETFSSGFSAHYLAPRLIENNPYKNLLSTPENRALFGQFLDNILDRVNKDDLYRLLDDIVAYSDTREEIYKELSKRIGEVMPSAINSASRIYRSLSNIKQDLSAQAATLMQSQNATTPINGLIEIGYPGRFVRSMRQKMNITGQITAMNDQQLWSDVIQSGFPAPYDRFVPLNDYDRLNKTLFADNSVDMITCFVGLHHIPENKIEAFLASLNRVLRPGGSFLLVDHDITDPKTRDFASLAHSIYNAVMGVPLEEEMNEIRNFKPLQEWKDLLQKFGFDVEINTDKTMIRNGDPTKNTMIRFVKKHACKQTLTAKSSLAENDDHYFGDHSKPMLFSKKKPTVNTQQNQHTQKTKQTSRRHR